MLHRYRRVSGVSSARSPLPAASDPSDPFTADPYTAYLAWVAEGRPPMPGASAARPEPGTVLIAEHVQVQQLAPPEERAVEPALASTRSVWSRVIDRLQGLSRPR